MAKASLQKVQLDLARAEIARYERLGAEGLHKELQKIDSDYRKITAKLVVAIYVLYKNEWYSKFDCETIEEYADKYLKGFNRRTVLAAIATVRYCVEENINIMQLIDNGQLWNVRYLAQVQLPAEHKKELLDKVISGQVTAHEVVKTIQRLKSEDSEQDTAQEAPPKMKRVDLYLSEDNYKMLNSILAKTRKDTPDITYEQLLMDALLVYNAANFGRDEESLMNMVARLQEQYSRPIIILGPDKRVQALMPILKTLEEHFGMDIIVVKRGYKQEAVQVLRNYEKSKKAKKADKLNDEE